jgi:gliding motility-associated-like protein
MYGSVNWLLLLPLALLFPILSFSSGTASKVTFLENKGQWDNRILYKSASDGHNVSLLRDGISFSVAEPYKKNPQDRTIYVWNLKFLGINPESKVIPENGRKTVNNYLFGNDPSKWVIHPNEYNSIVYTNIYNKTDLRFYGNGNRLEYDYILHPGSWITSIKSTFEGIDRIYLNDAGDIVIESGYKTQLQKAPVSWQHVNGEKISVDVSYVILNDSTFGFKINGKYDPRHDLIIDPLFQLVWSSYTNATGFSNNINYSFANAMDQQGNVYLTGMVDGTFPITPGAYSGPGTVVPEVFVAKFSSDGTTMLYSTYLPGNSSEHGTDIVVDDSGRAFVTGNVDLNITGITNFPSTANAYQPVHNTGSDAFLTVLNPDGTGLIYSTFIGGTGGESGFALALGPPGIVYVAGTTSQGNFPVVNSSVFPTGDNHAFVSKFDINQSGTASLLYSVKIGAGNFNSVFGRSIDVNSAGEIYLTGSVFNGFGSLTFPVTPGAYNSNYNGGNDNSGSYLLKLSATTPVSLIYSTHLGPGSGNGVAVHDVTDEAIVVGTTRTFSFPVTPGVIQPVHGQDALGNPNGDFVIMRMNSTGTALQYSTFLGGELSETATGVAVNSAGESYIAGIGGDLFPTSAGAYQPLNAGSSDFIIAHLNATGTAYACGGSTYIGGSDSDYSGSFYDYPSPKVSLIDNGGNFDTISVSSTSHSQDFPTTPGVYGPVKVNSIADQPVFFKMTCSSVTAPPLAQLVSQVNSGCNGVSVNFTDASTNAPTSWTWYFPGSGTATSTQQNPQNIIYPASGSYTVSLVACNNAGCDSTSATIQITIPSIATVNIGNDTLLCNGSSVLLIADTGYVNYNWQFNGISTGSNNDSLTANQSGIYSVIITDAIGCTASDSVLVTISNPQVNAGVDLVLCNTDSALITATPGFSLYQWQINSVPAGTNTNTIIASQPGIVTIQVTDSAGCTASDTISVSQSFISVTLQNDTSFCEGGSINLNSGSGFASIEWMLNGNVISTDSAINADSSGNYLVTVTDVAGCTATDSVMITEFQLPVIQTNNDTTLCEGDSISLNASGGITYLWNPVTYLNDPGIANPTAFPIADITYTVTGTDINGCSANDQVVVLVAGKPVADFSFSTSITCDGILLTTDNNSLNSNEWLWNFGDGTFSNEENPAHIYPQLQNQSIQLIAFNEGCPDTMRTNGISTDFPIFDSIPNIITPNGDQVNDCFKLKHTEYFNGCFNLKIFNRWGSPLFETTDPLKCWDGKSNEGNDVPEGTYFYLLRIGISEKNGTIQVSR